MSCQSVEANNNFIQNKYKHSDIQVCHICEQSHLITGLQIVHFYSIGINKLPFAQNSKNSGVVTYINQRICFCYSYSVCHDTSSAGPRPLLII
jgi:hypothetical protein